MLHEIKIKQKMEKLNKLMIKYCYSDTFNVKIQTFFVWVFVKHQSKKKQNKFEDLCLNMSCCCSKKCAFYSCSYTLFLWKHFCENASLSVYSNEQNIHCLFRKMKKTITKRTLRKDHEELIDSEKSVQRKTFKKENQIQNKLRNT